MTVSTKRRALSFPSQVRMPYPHRRRGRIHICILIIVLLICTTSVSWGTFPCPRLNGVGDRAVSFWDDSPAQALSVADSSVSALALRTKGLKRNVVVDPENRIITFEETVHGLEIRSPLIYDLSAFVKVRTSEGLPRLLRKHWTEGSVGAEERGSGRGGINIDIPVKFPRALTRIIGEGGGLRITGYRKISFSGRSEWTEGDVLTATHRPSKFPALVMEQRSQFKIEGTIGEKIHVYVDQDSERMTELENAIRINYEGFEDEIIQEIQAGNTSLSLPQTQFVSFSQKSTGLFGIKTTAKIGPFDLVAIASQDKGSGQRKSFQAGAESKGNEIADYLIKRGYYFFLDSVYVSNYELYDRTNWIHIADANYKVDSLEVLIDDGIGNNNIEDGFIPAHAVVIPPRDTAHVDPTFGDAGGDENYFNGQFRRLNPDEYEVNREMGYIILDRQVSGGQVLAVTYKQGGSWIADRIPGAADTTSAPIYLKLLRPKAPLPNNDTWDLEWKNVYSLGSTNIPREGFDVKIYRDISGEEDDDTQAGVKYATIMGLDRFDNQNQSRTTPDGLSDTWRGEVFNLARGELIFPTLKPFSTDFYFYDEKDTLNLKVPEIYDEANEARRKQAHKYNIVIETQNRQASYNLNINIIEGSEVVKLNGRTLQRGSDYNIIYEIGQITFLTDDALDPTADITVDYEYAPFFQPERKTLLGFRGEYSFWGDASWGATFLYRSESMPLNRRIRLGQEPTRAMVWESDLHLDFEPKLITDIVDALPFVQTNEPSSLKFSGEIAQSLPNSNTQGEAYVDDFDGSKNTISLGVMRGQWTPASPPTASISYDTSDARHGLYSIRSRGKNFYWYNPFEQVNVKEIWPNREAYAREGRTHVLTFEFTPNDSGEQSWAGVMRSLSQGNWNQSESKFLEIWVNGHQGEVNIDLGMIHEDVIPNNKLDSEDEGADQGIGDGLLDVDEDVGLDGMSNNDSRAQAAGGDFWDIDGDNVKDRWEPFSSDDWSYQSGSTDYEKTNGTEGNRNDPDRGIRPDTEDINNNGRLDTENKFFRYSFSLSRNSPDTVFVAGGDLDRDKWKQPDSWRLYRIPLEEASDTVGTPDMTNIQFIRMWITGVNMSTEVRFAAIDIVGNDWLENGIEPDTLGDETFAITVKNTHDNPEDYVSPPGVAGVIDPVTRLPQLEQSLVLKFENLAPGHSGSASQTFYGKAKDFTKYRILRMFVYGNIEKPDTSITQFFFRFGADEKNYYEYKTMVHPGWDTRNEIVIDFDELTNLKYVLTGGSGSELDTTLGHFGFLGKPSLSDIRRLTAGVKNDTTGINSSGQSVSGEVWIDELRLADARDDPGLAGRITVDAKLADLGAVKLNLSREDAEFQSLGAGSKSDSQKSSKTDGSVQGNINLHKFLPEKWGISLPFSGNYKKLTQLPKLRSGSDVNLNEQQQWNQRTQKISKGGSIRFSKQPSSFWLLGLTLDRIKMSASVSKANNRTSIDSTNSQQLSGSFTYDLSTKKDLSLSPLGWTTSKFVPKFISGTKITVIPSNISCKMDMSESKSESFDLRHEKTTYKSNRSTSQNFSGSMKPFGSVTTNFSLNRKIDSQGKGWKARLTTLNFGREMDRSQSFSINYKPPLLSWLGPSYSYRVNYHDRENSKVDPSQVDSTSTRKFGLDADHSINHSASASLNPSQLLVSLGAPKKGDKVGLLSPRMILAMVRILTDRFQTISGSYQIDQRSSFFNLLDRPSWQYQFGLRDSALVRTDPNLTGQNYTSSSGESWSAKSGVNLIAGVSANTSYSFNNKQSLSSSGKTETETVVFPQVSVRWGELGKLYLLRELVQSSSFDFSYKRDETKDGPPGLSEENLFSVKTSQSFSPLFSWSASWAKNLKSTLSSNWTETITSNRRQGSTDTKQTTSSLQASIDYRLTASEKGIKFPLLGKTKLKSDLSLKLDFKLNHNTTETDGRTTKEDKTRSITLGGSYSFSRKVKGGLKIDVSDRHDVKTQRKTKVRDVGIWTEIRFD